MKSKESIFLRALLADLKKKEGLEPEHVQEAGRALRALDHAIAVRDHKAVRKAVEHLLRVLMVGGIITHA